MHSQGPNTMMETLHCPGILGKASYVCSLQSKFFFSNQVNFLLSYGHFVIKIGQKYILRGKIA